MVALLGLGAAHIIGPQVGGIPDQRNRKRQAISPSPPDCLSVTLSAILLLLLLGQGYGLLV